MLSQKQFLKMKEIEVEPKRDWDRTLMWIAKHEHINISATRESSARLAKTRMANDSLIESFAIFSFILSSVPASFFL
jgi:hypothetical protein